MKNVYIAIFFMILAVFFVFSAIIINVRDKKSVITKTTDPDFIDKFIDKKKLKLRQIPRSMPFKTYVTLVFLFPVVFGLGTWFAFKILWISLIFFVLGLFVPEFLVRMSENKQKKDFEERYARALRQLASSLRAGMTLQQSVEDLCNCPFIHHEIKKEFKKIDADVKLGISIADAFQNMADRIPTDDVKDVASAIKMQSLVGGSEAESIEIISKNISTRIMLKKEIKTLFTGVRMTILGMDVLPPMAIVLFYVATPTYFNSLFSNAVGILVVVLSVMMMIVGSIINRKLIKQVKGVN